MNGPKGNGEFCFPKTLNVPRGEGGGGMSRVKGKQNSLFHFVYLAETLVMKSKTLSNPSDFAMAVDEEFADFQFPDDFIFDIWGAISDSKSGR